MNQPRFRVIGRARQTNNGGRPGIPYRDFTVRPIDGGVLTTRNFFDTVYQSARRLDVGGNVSATLNFTGLRGIRSVGLGPGIFRRSFPEAYRSFLRRIQIRFETDIDDSDTLIDADGGFMALDTSGFTLVRHPGRL